MSFFLLLAWIAYEEFRASGQPLQEVIFIVLVFACVLLHELGHALVAKRFNIETRDIVLYPFGGIAALMGQARPFAELLIAIAGPLVNVVIAFAISFFIDLSSPEALLEDGGVLSRVFLANVVLVLFNMIPALPMDGGRVLRAAMALSGIRGATAIAARLSQLLSIIGGLYALYTGNIILLIIAVVVFTNAVQEHISSRARDVAHGFRVKDVMIDAAQLVIFTHGMTISEALRLGLKSLQGFFPVMLASSVLGVVSRDTLVQAATSQEEDYIGSIMDRDFSTIDSEESLEALMARLETEGDRPLLVVHDEQLVGVLNKDKLLEFLLVQGLRRERERFINDSPED